MKDKKHIHGFKVPQDYFDNLEERIMQNIAMDQLPKDTGMRVPDGYFAQLDNRVITQIQSEKKKPSKLVWLITWWHVAVAASVIGFGLWLFLAISELMDITNTMVYSDINIDQ